MPTQVLPFPTLLRRHRRAAGLTQEALADSAGISLRGLQHLEAGDVLPTSATLHALEQALLLLAEEKEQFEVAASRVSRRQTPTHSRVSYPVTSRQRQSDAVGQTPSAMRSRASSARNVYQVGRAWGVA